MENPSPSESAPEPERTLVDRREVFALLRCFAEDLAERPDQLPLSEPTRRETVDAVAACLSEWPADRP